MAVSDATTWKTDIFNLEPLADASFTGPFIDMVDANANMELVGVTPPPSLIYSSALYESFLLQMSPAGGGFAFMAQGFEAAVMTSTFTPGTLTVNGVPVAVTAITPFPTSVAAGKTLIANTSEDVADGETDAEIIQAINLGDSMYSAYSSLQYTIVGTQVSNGAPFTANVGVT